MAIDYEIEWDPKALKELRKLDGTIRLQFLKKLQERQEGPRVPGDALHGMKDCYKIKLRGAGYRLVGRQDLTSNFNLVEQIFYHQAAPIGHHCPLNLTRQSHIEFTLSLIG